MRYAPNCYRTQAAVFNKSPIALARAAMMTAQQALDDYSHPCSPHKFTQPQLLSILILKSFFRLDYRGITILLQDFGDLRKELGLQKIPHFSTLWHAEQRLLKKSPSSFFRLLPSHLPVN